MHTWLATGLMGRVIRSTSTSSPKGLLRRSLALALAMAILAFIIPAATAHAQTSAAAPAAQSSATPVPQERGPAHPTQAAGEANLRLPDMKSVSFLNGSISGYSLLEIGLIFCALGGLFGLIIYRQLKGAAVHRSMREISELIYETCKTYLITQGKFILLLEA